MPDRNLFRMGGAAAVIGAVLALVSNLLHPRISDFEDPVRATLEEVAASDAWIPIHLGIVAGTLLIILGLFAVARSLKGGRAEGMARVALGSLLISGAVAVLTFGLDTYAFKAVADELAAASGPARDLAFASANAVAQVVWGTFMITTISFIGLTPVLYGVAVATSDDYPAGLGWGAVVLGLGAIVAGVMGLVGGPSAVFFVLFTVTSGLITLWVLVLGVLVVRKAGAAAPA